jgi:hypothetical protein
VFFYTELEGFRAQLGLVFIHLALESKSAEIRRNVYAVIAAATTSNPILTNQIIRDALASFFDRGFRTRQSISADNIPVPSHTHAKLSGLLLSAVSFAEETDAIVKEKAVVELIVLGHHRWICPCFTRQETYDLLIIPIGQSDRQAWIDLCHKAELDPPKLIEKYLDRLLKIVLENSLSDSEVKLESILMFQISDLNQGLSEASYTAIATLVFVAPSIVLPRLVEQLNEDIKPDVLNGISDFDLGVWATPEGTRFVDGQYQAFSENSKCLP